MSWVTVSGDTVPLDAFCAGYDSDSTQLYVGRAFHNGELMPGKFSPSKRTFFFAYGSDEIPRNQCEVLTGFQFSWMAVTNGNVPPNALRVGQARDGELLYIGRTNHKDILTLGHIHRSHGGLFYTYDGAVHSTKQYEVLCSGGLCKWVGSSTNGCFLEGAPIGGNDADGTPIYVGRANHGGMSWVTVSGDTVPLDAFCAGYDSDSTQLYVGRAFHNGELMPGKFSPSKRTFFFAYGSDEIPRNQCEVLTGFQFSWMAVTNGNVPPNALRVGQARDGELLYIGRTNHKDILTLGHIHRSHGGLFYTYDGAVHSTKQYEVLCSGGLCKWVGSSTNGCFLEGAPIGGNDADGTPIYVGRANHGGMSWVTVSGDTVPLDAFCAGYDSDSTQLYVGRAFHNGELMPGKFSPSKRTFFFAYGSDEIPRNQCEVLTGFQFSWMAVTNGNVPPNALRVGQARDGELLYIGRTNHKDILTLGHIHLSHGGLFYTYDGAVHSTKQYEVLCSGGLCKWVGSSTNGCFLESAPIGGNDADGTPIYVGRANHGGMSWVTVSGDTVPLDAFCAGYDSDSTQLYVGRAFHNGELMPGKFSPSKRTFFFAYGSDEIPRNQCEVLTGFQFSWMAVTNENVPPNALRVGQARDGELLYIGRTNHKDILTLGHIHRSHGGLFYTYDGSVHSTKQYEVLCSGGSSQWVESSVNGSSPECASDVARDKTALNWVSVSGATIPSVHSTKQYEVLCSGETSQWVQSSANGCFPECAHIGGNDVDGSPIYIGRANHENDLIPGKIIKQHAYVAWNLIEHCKENYEVLCHGNLHWIKTDDGRIPCNAVPGGRVGTGEILYIGRANYMGSLTVGKVHPSHKTLYIPFSGTEVPFGSYEILVEN